jgi:2-polyprenyl-3-methyl-5-hydroxy-6-metoxy-1,4-benzoquinol methylase
MRNIVCPTCNGTEKALVYRDTLPVGFDEAAPPSPYSAHYQINRCTICGLTHSSPVMDDAGVSALYEKSSETNVLPGEEENVRRTMAGYYKLASPHLPGRDRMLDVGCDMGFLLEAARADGFADVWGIEPVPLARQVAEKITGSHITAQFFEETNFPEGHFDLITLIHVLDHLFDPRVVLRRALVNLRPGGIIVAVVHNVDCLLGKILGERFPVFNLYHHYFFNKETLAELFRRHGFEVIDVVSTQNCYSMGFFAQRLPGVPQPLRRALHQGLRSIGLASLPVTVPVGNIGIVARHPVNGISQKLS